MISPNCIILSKNLVITNLLCTFAAKNKTIPGKLVNVCQKIIKEFISVLLI